MLPGQKQIAFRQSQLMNIGKNLTTKDTDILDLLDLHWQVSRNTTSVKC